ncbi:pyridoxal phosphate-dependent aminotransferase [bacterium]|nr:pyridoxal phosphate-dependent aminotransferase [bacterium]
MEKSVIRQIFDSAQPNSVNLGLGELQFPMPEYLHSHAVKILFDEDIRYTPNAGLINSRQAIATNYKNASPNQVIITNGAQEALYATLKTILNPGDEILLPDPGFSAYASIVKMLGALPKFYLLDERRNFALDNDSLFSQVTPKTKAILINTPGNPSGTALSANELNTIANCCRLNNLFLISDEIYQALYLEKSPPTAYDFYDKTIIISGLSKSHCMTGWRIGWALAPLDLAQQINVTHQYLTTCANYLGQRLCQYAFNDQATQYQRELRAKLRLNYRLFHDIMSNIAINRSDSAPYIFINILQDGFEFAKKMLDYKVIVIPGLAFSQRLTNWIRISYALPEEDLIIGAEILKKNLYR